MTQTKLCDNPGNIIQNKTILGVLLAFLLRIVYPLVKIFYFLHFSRVVPFGCQISAMRFAPKNLYVQSSNHNMVWKHHEDLISKLKFDSHIFVENVEWDWKRGLHHKAILVQVVRLHNFGEMEEQEVVNLIYNWKNKLQLQSCKEIIQKCTCTKCKLTLIKRNQIGFVQIIWAMGESIT